MSKTLEQWEDQAFTRIFQISLKNGDNSNIFLGDLADEFKSEGESEPILLSKNKLDRSIMEVLDNIKYSDKFGVATQYLVGCYARLLMIITNLQKKGSSNLSPEVVNERIASLNMAKDLMVSYLGLSLMSPEMFTSAQNLVYPDSVVGYQFEPIIDSLLDDLATRFNGDGLEVIVEQILVEINRFLITVTLSQPYALYLQAIHRIVMKKEFAVALTQTNSFLPLKDLEPNQLETVLLLGPTFSVSTYPDNKNPVHKEYFLNNSGENVEAVESNFAILRSTSSRINASVFSIVDKLVRASSESRNRCLQLFASILNLNVKRGGLQVDETTVSSDRFILGVQNVLLQLSQPFLNARHTKVASIDSNFFRNSKLLDVEDESKINCTTEQFQDYLSGAEKVEPNFISQIFHLTVRALHLGLIRTTVVVDNVEREVEDLEKKVTSLEARRSSWSQQPNSGFIEAMLTRFRAQLHGEKALLSALYSYLLDPNFVDLTVRFYNLTMTYVVRQFDPSINYPDQNLELPVYTGDQQPHLQLAVLPDYYVIDILDFLLFIGNQNSNLLVGASLHEFVVFLTAFLSHTGIVLNPHIKIKLVDVAYRLSRGHYVNQEGPLVPALLSNITGRLHLLPYLLMFYVEVEQTGLSSQFHDKFNVRYHIHQLLQLMWKHPDYCDSVAKFSSDLKFFVRFVNLLMNDTTYLLDEALAKLTEIHKVQSEISDHEAWNQLEPRQQQEREAHLVREESMATTYVALSNDNVHFLQFLTLSLPQPFLSSEIVNRLAAMLNYVTIALVGPKGPTLKVQQPEKYRFDPKLSLKLLTQIYLNLNTPLGQPDPNNTFVLAVAADGRSYNHQYFLKVLHLLQKFNLLDSSQISQFRNFLDKVKLQVQSAMEDEIDLGDIPDEFLDPLMATLMLEPVLLPTSKHIVDLSTIKAHLLSDNKDPFNRQPLTLDQVVPDLELKQKIQEFLDERKNSK